MPITWSSAELYKSVMQQFIYTPVEGLSETIDSSTALQEVLDAAAAAGAENDTFAVVNLQPGQKIKINNKITVDVGRVFLRGNGACLDCSSMSTSTGIGVLVTSSRTAGGWVGADGWGQLALGGIEHLGIYGPGRTGTSIGLKFDEAGAATSVRCRVNAHIDSWGRGEYLGDNAYLINHYSCELTRNVVGIYYAAGATNAGENNHWMGGSISNNDLAIFTASAGGFIFHGTHFDYNQQLWQNSSGGALYLRDGSWVEFRATGVSACTFPYIDMGNAAGKFSMDGGEWLCVQDSGEPTATEVLACNNASAEIEFTRVNFTKAGVSGNVFGRGACKFAKFRDNTSPDWTLMPALSHTGPTITQSRLFDGKFASTALVDFWTVLNDGGSAPTQRYSGTNFTSLALDAANDRVEAVRLSTGTAIFGVIIPIKTPQERFGVRIKYSASPTPGTMDITAQYMYSAGPGRSPASGTNLLFDGMLSSEGSLAIATGVTPPGAGFDAEVFAKPVSQPNGYRNWFAVAFNITGITAGKSVYIKEVEITSW